MKAIVSALKEKQQTILVNAEPSSGIFIGTAWKVVLKHAMVRKVEFGRFLGIVGLAIVGLVWYGLVWYGHCWFGLVWQSLMGQPPIPQAARRSKPQTSQAVTFTPFQKMHSVVLLDQSQVVSSL